MLHVQPGACGINCFDFDTFNVPTLTDLKGNKNKRTYFNTIHSLIYWPYSIIPHMYLIRTNLIYMISD